MMEDQLKDIDWQRVAEDLHQQGYARIRDLMTADQCNALIQGYEEESLYRKTVVMERHRFGKGTYKYFNYPLPPMIHELRAGIYPHLASTANRWMEFLRMVPRYPDTLEAFHLLCKATGQSLATPLILKYGAGGYNTLHQDLYGEIYFPFQIVIFLSAPGKDYTGGEFVMTEQVPRAQSRAIVMSPEMGNALVFATSFRPVKGTRGYYRASMRHGVSTLLSGRRYTAGIIFHDAKS